MYTAEAVLYLSCPAPRYDARHPLVSDDAVAVSLLYSSTMKLSHESCPACPASERSTTSHVKYKERSRIYLYSGASCFEHSSCLGTYDRVLNRTFNAIAEASCGATC